MDILFKTPENVFSYRVGGVLEHGGKVLFQRIPGEEGYAIPGGHVAFGETAAQALVRECREELGIDVRVGPLLSVAEIFIPWDTGPCHQICLYYRVEADEQVLNLSPVFPSVDELDGEHIKLDFCWIGKDKIPSVAVYPPQIADRILSEDDGITHFVYRE